MVMGKKESGITLKTEFIKAINQFIKDNPEKSITGVPEALRIAWDRYTTEQKLAKIAEIKSIEEIIDAIEKSLKK